ncbi:MAG: universal stress protein [Winogradskyella sp.]|uniref:universal stress protein n=1 Tax=Winogradskyella sp. TaxID=1883156 RepID=UPI000F408628|nr:universal stress protein [Winogradskyella sp.]RNC87758.1 MAG: universal stress protein [Winogradskyella sp.]
MKTILLLTDFSENSINAIRYSLQLFEDDLCNFFVMHVHSSSNYISDDLMHTSNKSIHHALIDKYKHRIVKLIVKLKNEFKNDKFNYQILVDYDSLTDAVNQVIQSKNIDLVVMGTNGVTGAKEVIFGSNTINVIRKVDYPTLVVPEGFSYTRPEEVLLPLDSADSISESAFIDILKFIQQFGKKIHLLRVKHTNETSKEAKKYKDHISYFLKDIDYEYHSIKHVPIHHAVSCYTQTHNINFTALIVEKESLFERFFANSKTSKISNRLKTPLLVFHS